MSQFSTEHPRRPLIPFVILAVSLVLTALAALYVAMVTREQDRARFETAIERTQNAITRRLDTYINLLRSGASMFAAQEKVTHKEFRRFVTRLQLDKHYPGIQGIGISARVMPHQMDEIKARMAEAGFDNFTITPDHSRDEHHLILYLEPLDRRNAAAIGYDMFTEPTRRAAMERARDTGEAATSGKVILVQEIDPDQQQAGLLIYVPIYYLGGVPTTVELRRMLLAGFCYAPFRADDLLQGIFGKQRYPIGVSFRVYDGDSITPGALLHVSDPGAGDDVRRPRFEQTASLLVPGGRQWTVAYRSGPPFESTSARELALLVVAAGTVVSLSLFALSYKQARAKQTAERAMLEARASEGKFRRLADANLVGVAFTSADGRILDGNGELFRILGRQRSEALSGTLRWDQITAPEYRERDNDAQEQLRTRGVCAPYEKEYLRPDGSRAPVIIGLARLEDSDDRVGLVIDLTSRVAAERAVLAAKEAADAARAQAEEASRLKDDFLATVSHELRTPLNAIFGWAQLLRRGHGGRGDELAHGLEIIERSARAQSQLIDDLLDVSRIVAGKLRLEMQSVSLAPVIEGAIASIRPAADAKGVQLIPALDPHAAAVNGDSQRLGQIVWNLLSNAVKFTPRGGSVRISLERIGSNAVVTVADTGIGIAREFLPHIFQRFRQADPTSTRSYGGLGLGLAIVRHLVELHGGTVEAHSEGEGRGATFRVMLPLAAAHAPRARVAAPEDEHRLDGVRVLLVEDDADSRELVVAMLRERGAMVTAAASAADAFASFNGAVPDVVLSDIGMPNEDGYMLLAKLRALPPERGGTVPVVALTALARPEDRRRALLAGFQVHLPKPVDANELVEVVSRLAREKQGEPQRAGV